MSPQDRDRHFWAKSWAKRDGSSNPFAQTVLRNIPEPQGKTLLDLGCGDGRDAIAFADAGFSVTAVDYSESGIAKLKSARPDIRAMQADIRELQFPEGSFDVVYAHLSLHYFDDATTRTVLERIRMWLKPRGFFFVKCKSTKDPLYGKGKKIGPDMYAEGHLRHFFSEDYLREMLAGYDILKLQPSRDRYEGHESAFVEAVAQR